MSVKEKIEDYLNNSIYIDYNDDIQFHPIRILEAMKSLYGIDPNKSNTVIYNNFSSYLNNFQINNTFKLEIETVDYFASMINLQILLDKKKFTEAKSEIQRLLQVSTGEPIFELLIITYLDEIYLLPHLISIFRISKFCNGHNINDKLLFIVDLIEKYQDNKENLKYLNYLNYFTTIVEVSKNTFIRDQDIKYKISKLDMKSITRKIRSEKKTKLGKKLIIEGREYLLTLIKENPLIIESDENILLFDSIRVLLRYRSSTKNDNQIHFAVSKLNINEI